jgi:RNA polymerase sigma-70 factor, ECF subfamily
VIVAPACGHMRGMLDVASACSGAAVESLAERESSSDIETLLNAHFGFIWRVFRRMGLCPADADDATQQVFMIASSKLDQMAPDRERAFLYGVALRVHGHFRRSQRRRREVPIESAGEREAGGFGPERQAALNDAWQLLDELLGKLPEKLRRVLVLVEVEELEVAEVALLEGVPVGTAASRLRLGRERFRGLLAKHSARNPFGGEL